jgi:KaiC/GvpD/RAD55 family RecA-like ATPase
MAKSKKVKLNKIKTGISGLDTMLNNGLIEGRPYVVSGGPGAGKTILGFQFLMEGKKHDQTGIYLTLSEPAHEIRQNMETFGWDTSSVKILDGSPQMEGYFERTKKEPALTPHNLLRNVSQEIEENDHKRVVIDSLTAFKLLYGDGLDVRKLILKFMRYLTNQGCTTLLLLESKDESIVNLEDFLSRGVIRLHQINVSGEIQNAISINKMRGTDFDKHIRPMSITSNGIVVHSRQTMFSSA